MNSEATSWSVLFYFEEEDDRRVAGVVEKTKFYYPFLRAITRDLVAVEGAWNIDSRPRGKQDRRQIEAAVATTERQDDCVAADRSS